MNNSRHEPLSSLKKLTLGDWAALFGVVFVVSLMCSVAVFFLEMHYFTATESEVPWFYPLTRMVTLALMVGALGLITIGIVALLRRFTSHRSVR